MEHKYAGQSWVSDLREKSGLDPVAMLQLIVKDLKDTVSREGISGPLELWENPKGNVKGFFVGDTSTLPDRGYTFITKLL